MQFGLQHPNFSFDYDSQNNNADTSQIADFLKNLITKAENSGFDSFWVMDHFHQIQFVGRPEEHPLQNNQRSSQGEVRTGTSKEEYAAPTSNHKDILSSAMTIMKLENILKNKDRYIVELLEKNERLGTENQKMKEKIQANTSEGVLKVKVDLSPIYRDVLLVRNSNASQANILISNGKYIKLEPV